MIGGVEDRFWAKVSLPDPGTGCMEWTAWVTSSGYGGFSPAHRTKVVAHRFAYERLVGEIPDGLQLDHLCRNRLCVRPGHLEPVTVGENVLRGEGLSAVNARKTECPVGHPLIGENVYRKPDGRRVCRACRRRQESGSEFRARRRAYLRVWRQRKRESA